MEPELEVVGPGRRFLIAIVDGILVTCLAPLSLPILLATLNYRTVLPEVAWAVAGTCLSMALVVCFGGTPAKLLLGARVVDERGRLVGIWAAFRREAIAIVQVIVSTIGLHYTIAALSSDVQVQTFGDLARVTDAAGQNDRYLAFGINLLGIADVLVILLNRRRRALHDYLAGTYVITLRSYRAANGLEAHVPTTAPRLPATTSVKVFAVLVAVSSGWSILHRGLLDLLMVVGSRQFWGEGLHGPLARDAAMMLSPQIIHAISIAAAIGLWRRRAWARSWMVACSCALLLELGIDLSVFPHETIETWAQAITVTGWVSGLDAAAAVTGLALPIGGLWLLLVRHAEPSANRRTRWLAWSAAFGLTAITLACNPFFQRRWHEQLVAMTTIEPGEGTIVVTPRFAGAPLTVADGTPAHVVLYEAHTQRQFEVDGSMLAGTFTTPVIPTGIYDLRLTIDANRDNGPGLPGDFEGSTDGDSSELARAGATARSDVKVYEKIRLLSPDDTGSATPPRSGCATLGPTTDFAWEPVPTAIGYRCTVTRQWATGRETHSEWLQCHFDAAPRCRIALPPSAYGESYLLEIEAEGSIGRLTTFGTDTRDWGYCFRVVEHVADKSTPSSMR